MAEDLSLQSPDRLVKIVIGIEQLAPIYIQQKVLESVAPWSKNALKPTPFLESQAGLLRFPEDDKDAWKVLVYWILKRDFVTATRGTPLSQAEQFELLVKCWVLGDKHDIKQFQDEAMTSLLALFQTYCISEVSDEALNRIFKICPPGSKLAELVALEISRDIKHGRISWNRARNLDLVNIWSDYCDAQLKGEADSYVDPADCRVPVLEYASGGHFMVGDTIVARISKQAEENSGTDVSDHGI